MLFLPERCTGIHCIIIFSGTQQFLIITDRQESGGKKDGTAAFIQAFLQIYRRIHTEQLQFKTPVRFMFRVNHIIFIHPLMHIQKMPQLQIKFLHFLFLRKCNVF